MIRTVQTTGIETSHDFANWMTKLMVTHLTVRRTFSGQDFHLPAIIYISRLKRIDPHPRCLLSFKTLRTTGNFKQRYANKSARTNVDIVVVRKRYWASLLTYCCISTEEGIVRLELNQLIRYRSFGCEDADLPAIWVPHNDCTGVEHASSLRPRSCFWILGQKSQGSLIDFPKSHPSCPLGMQSRYFSLVG